MKSKNRHLFGAKNAKAKLTDEQVREIHRRYRRGGVSTYNLADEYGVGQGTIFKILHGVRWEHIFREFNAAQE
jgi:hypothetical protein